VEEQKEKQVKDIDVFLDLKRRLKITRKARIAASRRLRLKQDFYDKVIHFYSLVILVFSIWFVSAEGATATFVTKVLLILSVSLTFFTMYVNIRNYKERASNFEANYQSLDILLNKIERLEALPEKIDQECLKGLHREYEKLLIEKENHLDIDYWVSVDPKIRDFSKHVEIFEKREGLIKLIVAVHPILLLLIILGVNHLTKVYLF
jgi:SMODS and SLOG-associating 2TM effector domain family 5